MKKKRMINSLFTLIFATIIFLNYIPVSASTLALTTANVVLRSGPNTSKSNEIETIPKGTTVTVIEQHVASEYGCVGSDWSKISYNGNTGYACNNFLDHIEVSEGTTTPPTSDMAKMTDEEFEAYLTSQNFPETYKVYLRKLHKTHPSWVFVAVKTKYNWSDAIKNQNVSGRSYYQSTSTSSQGYLSTDDAYYNWETDKFKVMEGSTWYQANVQTIEYYMDPRNFLNESGIFMFEKLTYNPSFHTSDVVKNIIPTATFSDLIPYFMKAADTYNVSPVYLAAKSRQEVGLNGGVATDGTGATYCGVKDDKGNKVTKTLYNFYAIGANKGVCDGIRYAYNKGWDTKEKAIVEGAGWIVNGYINAFQDTTYFQKWNTSIKATKAIYHQYATDVRYAASTATTTKNTYNNMGLIEYPYVFDIPIYEGIPNSTSLPNQGNPNNYLKQLEVNGASVTNFDGSNTSYTVYVPFSATNVDIKTATVNSNAKVNGNGKVNLTGETTNINIVVTAQNGNTRTYTVKVIKLPEVTGDKEDENEGNEDAEVLTADETVISAGYKISDNTYLYNLSLGSTVEGIISKLQKANPYASINLTDSNNKTKTSGSIVTGDKIIINVKGLSKTYAIVIYGDLNGDGEITVVDLGKLQKHLLKTSTLSGAYAKAADTDKNGSITVVDLGKVQKHLLKISNISQS